MVDAVAEPVNTERAGILARRHAHPGRNGNRRDDAFEAAVSTDLHQAPNVRQVLEAKEQLGGSAVEPQNDDFHGNSAFPSIAAALGTPRKDRIVGARSSSRAPSSANVRFMNSTPGT